jgi:superfamily II DNA or RNA helicase
VPRHEIGIVRNSVSSEASRPVILTERRDHLDYLRTRLQRFTKNLVVLYGGMSATERREAEERLKRPDNEERLVLATGRYLGEGFDQHIVEDVVIALLVLCQGGIESGDVQA